MTEPLTQKSPLRVTPDQMPQTYAPGGTTVDPVQLFVYTAGSPQLMEGQIEGLALNHRLMEANPSVETHVGRASGWWETKKARDPVCTGFTSNGRLGGVYARWSSEQGALLDDRASKWVEHKVTDCPKVEGI